MVFYDNYMIHCLKLSYTELHGSINQIICMIFYYKSMIVFCTLNIFSFHTLRSEYSWNISCWILSNSNQSIIYYKFERLWFIYNSLISKRIGILFLFLFCLLYYFVIRGCRFRGCMVVGFTTTYAISAYHHWCVRPNLDQSEVYSIMLESLSVTCGSSVVFPG
jgi:hypothetical protein